MLRMLSENWRRTPLCCFLTFYPIKKRRFGSSTQKSDMPTGGKKEKKENIDEIHTLGILVYTW
jgi:hypothetical protein